MNRHTRRASTKSDKSWRVDPVVAVHEAGHAVARYVTAQDLNVPVSEAISYIDLYPPGEGPVAEYEGDRIVLMSQACTFGPMFSAAITDIWIARAKFDPAAEDTLEFRQQVLAEARRRGHDLDRWLGARGVIAVAGPLVEAVHTNIPFYEVFDGPAGANDKRSLVTDCLSAGMRQDGIIDFIHARMEHAHAMLCNERMLGAINALASHVVKCRARVDGRTAISVIKKALQ